MLIEILCFMLIGAFTGLAAGLLGIGGGLIIVPFSLLVFEMLSVNNGIIIPYQYQVHVAIATSLATIIFTALSSIHSQQKKGAIDWSVFWILAPGIFLGAFLGAGIASYLPRTPLLLLFASFILLVSIKMWFGWSPHSKNQLPGWPGMNIAAIVIGCISAIVGIGGGTMTVPFLNRGKISIQRAVAVSSALGLPIALSGSLGFLWSSLYQPISYDIGSYDMGSYDIGVQAQGEFFSRNLFLGYIYLPAFFAIISLSMLTAPLGVSLSHKLSKQALSRVFSILLLVLAIKLYLSN
ncbi:MAG: sulfite exporter TauE/SafE family protein [Gammaproteobacteria bacterium]|nr:sulfite exporter TauE/SafE family protein [Gammaproteobacteria bacterium]